MNKCKISWERVVCGTGIDFAVKLVCGRAARPQGAIRQEESGTAGHSPGLYLQLSPCIPHLLSLHDNLLLKIFSFLKLT